MLRWKKLKTRKHFKDKKSHYVDESEWTIFENTHEPIIDQGTFDNVQRIRVEDMEKGIFIPVSQLPRQEPRKTTYKVRVHFSQTSTETMSDKIERMLKNEMQQM